MRPVLLVGALIPLASFALFHLVTVFPISWITLFTQRSAGEFLMVQCSGAFICAGAVVASGLIADQIGRRMLLLISAGLIAVFAIGSIIAPLIVEENAIGQTIYVNAGFALLGLSYGQSSGAVTSQLDQRYPLHRRGPHQRPRLAARGWLRAADRSVPVGPLRARLRRPVPAVGGGHHPAGAQPVPLGNPAGLNRAERPVSSDRATGAPSRLLRGTMK